MGLEFLVKLESVKFAVGRRQTKLNFLSGVEWMVGRVVREVADLAVEVGESFQVSRLLEEWEVESRTGKCSKRSKAE